MTYQLSMREEFDCPRSAADAFAYITDFARISEWDHTIVSSKKASKGKIGIGSLFNLVYSMGLRKIPISYEITEFDSPRHAVLVGKAPNFTAVDTVTISEADSGCHVIWQANIEFTGPTAKIVQLLKPAIVKAGRKTIQDLATALEDNNDVPKLGLSKSFADKLVLPGLAGFTKYGYQLTCKNWKPVTANMEGKHIVITGPTSGLGLATARDLAERGANLTLVARNEEKVNALKDELIERSGNTLIRAEVAELSDIEQIKELADRLNKRGQAIDVLINNAGALLNPRRETPEGLEASFALLLLGPVILTELLKPLLAKAEQARVINVSSGGMYAKRISVSNLESYKGKYSGADAYARSKRGLVMAGEFWAKHWADDNIIVHSMHPGWAKTPGVEKSLPEFNKLMQLTLRSAEQGADTIVWLACATEAAKCSGLFWLDREPHSTHLSNKTIETSSKRQELFDLLREYAERFDVSLELGT